MTKSLLLIHERLHKLELNMLKNERQTKKSVGKFLSSNGKRLDGIKGLSSGINESFVEDVEALTTQLYKHERPSNQKYYIDDVFEHFKYYHRTLTKAQRNYLEKELDAMVLTPSDPRHEMIFSAFERCYPKDE